MFDQAPLDFSKLPQQPHGGVLVDQVVPGPEVAEETERARSLPSIRVDLEAVITIEMICTGVLSPIRGFMTQADYTSVLTGGRLANGTIWPVPLSFAPTGNRNAEIIAGLSVGDEIALTDEHNDPVAILSVEDLFDYDKDERARNLFGTTDRSHPGVDSIHRRMGDTSIGGELRLLKRVDWGPFEKLRMEPKDTWRQFYQEREYSSVAGFITGANPLHRGHEYIHRNALEEVDAVFLQPLVEMAKREYVRHEYRVLAYRNVLEQYYPKDRAMLAPLRVTYIFAGPRETILHALIMKNYGCTHALVGRDHAGIGDFYDKYASHRIFEDFPPEELGIEVRLFHEVFYCTRCAMHGTAQTCPHDAQYRLNISGTGIREMLRQGIIPPKEVIRPESAMAAIQGIQPKGVDEAGQSITPVGKTINSMYPYYRDRARLGGQLRRESIPTEELTTRDLEGATQDARANAGRVYDDVYSAYVSVLDHNRAVQPTWIDQAQRDMAAQQARVVADLEEKLSQAPESTSDEFMYQDRAEVERELQTARAMLEHIPAPADEEQFKNRAWNVLEYRRYRGED